MQLSSDLQSKYKTLSEESNKLKTTIAEVPEEALRREINKLKEFYLQAPEEEKEAIKQLQKHKIKGLRSAKRAITKKKNKKKRKLARKKEASKSNEKINSTKEELNDLSGIMDSSTVSKNAKTKERERGIPSYVLDDLSSRFIINSRFGEEKSIIRIFFQIETAYWFYLDFHCVENSKLRECSMKEFSYALINHVPQLKQYVPEFEKHFEAWKQYKRTIGTYGAIIIDKTMKHVLLVQSFAGKNSWGFPKGKINQNESPVDCAAREVLEETGFDIIPHVDPCEYLERHANDQQNRLYLIDGIPLETNFQPKTRREIRDIQWFPLEMLLSHSHKSESSLKETVGQNINLYTVVPYLRAIKRWIVEKQSGNVSSKQRHKQKQQKQFSQQNQNQYQEYMQFKKGNITTKNFVNQRKNSVRYSREIIQESQDAQSKQGKRGMTVVQSLFGHQQASPRDVYKPPEVDTKSFYSETWFNFTLDVDAIMDILPHEGTFYFPTNKI